jgi:Predicted ATP-binding protein involved in virulence
MELLYLWVNFSKRGVIKEQGFNFSPKYQFDMAHTSDKWELSQDLDWRGKESIFKSEVIENITAIVGKNGTGKTTLLNYLSHLDCKVINKNKYGKGYEKLKEEREKQGLCLFVIKDKEVIKVYHNFKSSFYNTTGYETVDVAEGETCREMLLSRSEYRNITKIYLSNSNYGTSGGAYSDRKLDELMLSPNSLSTLSKTFYRKLLKIENIITNNHLGQCYRRIIYDQKEYKDFQQICDIMYLYKLYDTGDINSYLGKVSFSIEINSECCINIIDKEYPDFSETDEHSYDESKIEKGMNEAYRKMRKMYETFLKSEDHISRVLFTNLVFEICVEEGCPWPKTIKNYHQVKEWLVDNVIGENSEYYNYAIKEIEELKNILKNAEKYPNTVPKDDLGYHDSVVLDYEKGKDVYVQFMEFFMKCFNCKNSFVLRYIQARGIDMSSGERAFHNFFSWINLVPQFQKISNDIPEGLKDTVLLLIDEIDLYLHPEWQVKFLKNMVSELEAQFIGKKLQIISTTHSPLCLSDIPKENTIYLTKNGEKITCQDRKEHKQTFGRDVYTLLNDTFYLSDCTMGAYAKSYINNIFEKIYNKDTQQLCRLNETDRVAIREQISYIGNDILEKKLTAMLGETMDSKEKELEYLKNEVQQLEVKIAELEER